MSVTFPRFVFEKDDKSIRLIENEGQIHRLETIDRGLPREPRLMFGREFRLSWLADPRGVVVSRGCLQEESEVGAD